MRVVGASTGHLLCTSVSTTKRVQSAERVKGCNTCFRCCTGQHRVTLKENIREAGGNRRPHRGATGGVAPACIWLLDQSTLLDCSSTHHRTRATHAQTDTRTHTHTHVHTRTRTLAHTNNHTRVPTHAQVVKQAGV